MGLGLDKIFLNCSSINPHHINLVTNSIIQCKYILDVCYYVSLLN